MWLIKIRYFQWWCFVVVRMIDELQKYFPSFFPRILSSIYLFLWQQNFNLKRWINVCNENRMGRLLDSKEWKSEFSRENWKLRKQIEIIFCLRKFYHHHFFDEKVSHFKFVCHEKRFLMHINNFIRRASSLLLANYLINIFSWIEKVFHTKSYSISSEQ